MHCRIPSAAFVLVLSLLTACGGGSSSPLPPTSPAPPPAGGLTTGRVVSVLDEHHAVAGAALNSDLGPIRADDLGYFSLTSASAGLYALTISGTGWIERQTGIKVPGVNARLSLIPSAFDLTYFDEMCRLSGRIARWDSAPMLVVETAVLTHPTGVAIEETVPPEFVAQTVEQLRRTLPVLSAGRFPDFAGVETRRTAAGTSASFPNGAIVLTWRRGLIERFGHVAFGRRTVTALSGPITDGEVALDYDWRVFGLPAGSRRDIVPVEQHELGHTLGFSHTRRAPSFMYEVFLMTVSSLDRQAFEIFMQRPNGNQAPDRDPTGASTNLMPGGSRRVDICERLPAPMR